MHPPRIPAACVALALAAPATPAAARTLAEALAQYGESARARLRPLFARAGLAYPPTRTALVALKDEKLLELWAEAGGRQARVHGYPILAASGVAGPKLREGDRQVPEGLYRISWLNPSSSFHLSMKVDYPNAFDRAQAQRDGRSRPGGDIFVHGSDVSIGCIAVGDTAIEELFVLAADTHERPLQILIAPRDLRRRPLRPGEPQSAPDWVRRLYQQIEHALDAFPTG